MAVKVTLNRDFFDEAAFIDEGKSEAEWWKYLSKELEIRKKSMYDTFTLKDQGTGELTTYTDTYANVTAEDLVIAEELEREMRDIIASVEVSYLELAKRLDEFDRRHLYLARGAPSFYVWLKQTTELGISYRTAHDLIRIVREALPIMLQNGKMDYIPPISKMRALLPALADGDEKFLEALEASKNLTVADTYDRVEEIRGIAENADTSKTKKPFRAVIRKGEDKHMVKIFSTNEDDQYTLGFLTVKKSEWAVFEKMFGDSVAFELTDSRTTSAYDVGDTF